MAISNDYVITATDVNTELNSIKNTVSGKADSSHTHTIAQVTNLQSTLDGKVPTSRTVNGKALTGNISLSASDVGASSSGHNHDGRYAKGNTSYTSVSSSMSVGEMKICALSSGGRLPSGGTYMYWGAYESSAPYSNCGLVSGGSYIGNSASSDNIFRCIVYRVA